MHPAWGAYGAGGPQPQPFCPRNQLFRGPPPPVGGFGGYGAPSPAAASNFSSLHEQHLQQMHQLQQLHQRQLQSVLHYNNNNANNANFSAAPASVVPPQWTSTAAGCPPSPAHFTPDSTQNRGAALQEPPTAPAPQNSTLTPTHTSNTTTPTTESAAADQKKTSDLSAMNHRHTASPAPPNEAPPPPPPKEEPPPPPPPDDKPSMVVSADPAEAARLQQLQAAAAQWQHVQYHRAGYQYQALMQEHTQLQQILHRYQQVIQQPAHIQSMSVDMQLQHYEMQQQQFAPVLQDWDRHFKIWLEQFQAYPHKDQLQEYEGQWRQWQEQMTSTSVHLGERVTTLRGMKQTFVTGDSYTAVMGPYGQSLPPVSDMGTPISPNTRDNSSGPPEGTNQTNVSGPNTGEKGPISGSEGSVGPPGIGARQPGPHGRFEGPRGPRFEGPRGPRFEPPRPPQQRFSGPPRFDSGYRFGMPPRGRFENPLRQTPPSWFERPPGPHIGPPTKPPPLSVPASQAKPDPVNQTNSQLDKHDSFQSSLSQSVTTAKNENKPSQDETEQKSMSDDILDSGDSFFVQTGPIPQSQTDKGKKDETVRQAKEEESNKDSSKKTVTLSAPVQSMQTPGTDNKTPEAPKNPSAPQQRPQPFQQAPFQPDMPKEPPCTPREINASGPPYALRGRGRAQVPLPLRGRGRGRSRGQFGRPIGPPSMSDSSYHREDASYDHQPPVEEDYGWDNRSDEPLEMMDDQEAHETWPSENHQLQKDYYEETGKQAPPRAPVDPAEGLQEHWEEEQTEYWEEEPYWADRRASMVHHRPPFPAEGPRRPPFHPRFMHHGPRRPPTPLDMKRDPRGPPPLMGPRFRRGGPGPWGPPPRHDMIRRPPPPSHEYLEREPVGPPGYHEEINRNPCWPHSHGRETRHPPLPPHETINRDLRRPPMRPHSMSRGRWRRPPHEDPQEGYDQEYGTEFDSENDGYKGPPPDYRHRGYREDEEFHNSREEWRRELADFSLNPPRCPPPDHLRDNPWREERDRPFSYENEDRSRAERRGPGYADGPLYRDRDREPSFQSCPDWEGPPLPERVYPEPTEETRSLYERNPELPITSQSTASESSLDQISPGENKTVLALSQRQHEIILKAAQELKMIRELQESKKVLEDTSNLKSSGMPTEITAGLLGLEIPLEVKTALQVSGILSETGRDVSGRLLESGNFLQAASAPLPKPCFIAKTVDYGHGHDVGTKVEKISYGERIVLRPDPLPSDRPYEKELLARRDPYYDRRSEPYMDQREYGRDREREMFRERPPLEYDRDRLERERYSREERPPLGPPRPAYRDRERDVREHSGRSSRDRDPYNRPGYERSSYERALERYDHGASPYGHDRRGEPPPPPPPVPQRVEKKPETKNVDDILKPPGRATRPDRIVVIMRGLPGSGKSHLAKLIRDKEVEFGGAPPRVLGLDDYFMTEVEKEEKDPDTGKRIKTKVMEYEYEPEMEETYRNSMLKTFRKTLDDGFFPFIILDAINEKVKYFDQFWSAAKTKGFELASSWESAPVHMARLDLRSLLQDAAIEEVCTVHRTVALIHYTEVVLSSHGVSQVEMEDFNPSEMDAAVEEKKEEEEEAELGYLPKSKWEMDTSEAKLDKLDGLAGGGKRKRDVSAMEDFLQLPDDYASRMSQPGKKRVRWADLEEQKDADRKRAIGFVVGQTDWEKITDESGQLAQRALNRTKYF
ncbi:YLP motif-containing protein 1 [Bagarius yarrelli]|uniref:YLP motif-containing protein 1 n=1 Tax=Bagarius yarrelli TaxID=175774 RepID=A0A556VW25_BAGYA|nr:YLP motif-containing protein 1 [Bagarius yarrelli]